MIRIILLGRTGNNLFQYAFGRVLAARHQVPIILDGSWYNREGWREVSHFLELQTRAVVVRPAPLASRLLRKLTDRHHWEFTGRPVIREPQGDMSFQPAFLNAPKDCILFGYFQSPRYFESHADEIRHEIGDLLEIAALPSTSGDLLESLRMPKSVAVHVRRGDYLKHPEFQVCTPTYYSKAIESVRANVPDAKFHIFSDDPDWCRQHFSGPDLCVIDQGKASENPLKDLFLMSQASHHIIANSSYSWWAAWLGKKSGQQVICPPRWFQSGIHAPIGDKLADGWSLLPEQAEL